MYVPGLMSPYSMEVIGLTATHPGGPNYNLGIIFKEESGRGITHPFFASILNAFKEEADKRGYDITFVSNRSGDQTIGYLENCRRRGVDGVCIVCINFSSEQVTELARSGIPCVSIDHSYEGVSSVFSDNAQGIRMLVDYAVSMGHRRIAYIHGQQNSNVTAQRIAQFREAMRDHGLDVPENFLVDGNYDNSETTGPLVEQLLSQRNRPTCILLPDDASYVCAQDAARRCELRVPADISFAGYDGIRVTQLMNPRLTTIRQDGESMGRKAADLLIQRIEHPDEPVEDSVTVAVQLLKGGTVGWCNEWSF